MRLSIYDSLTAEQLVSAANVVADRIEALSGEFRTALEKRPVDWFAVDQITIKLSLQRTTLMQLNAELHRRGDTA